MTMVGLWFWQETEQCKMLKKHLVVKGCPLFWYPPMRRS